MARPFTGSQIERLGRRLAESAHADQADIDLLQTLLRAYSEVLGIATERVRASIGYGPTARVKSTGTILEKLRRYGGSWLKSIQDLAGMRVVASETRDEQDALVAQIVGIFAGEDRVPKVIDRRDEPVQGYRAVHVVVFPGGFPIEVQVRTRLQHEWAELFEKLADVLGRGIRYGEPAQHVLLADPPEVLDGPARRSWLEASEVIGEMPQLLIECSNIIDVVERQDQTAGEIGELRHRIAGLLTRIHVSIDMISKLEPPAPPADEAD